MDQNDRRVQPPFPPYNTTQPGTPSRQGTVGQQAPRTAPPTSSPTPGSPSSTQPLPTSPPPTFVPPMSNEAPPTVTNPYYLAGYLRNFIGRFVRVEFTLGTTGALNDRIGILQDVGASYVVLRQFPSNDMIVGDLYSIKFVTVYDTSNIPPISAET